MMTELHTLSGAYALNALSEDEARPQWCDRASDLHEVCAIRDLNPEPAD